MYYAVPLKYRYNAASRSYRRDDTIADNEAYIFVYVTKQTLDVKWDHTGVAYTYKGGIVYTSATVSTPDEANKTEVTLNVPIRINSNKAVSVSFADYGFCHSNVFTINPYDTTVNGKFFARNATYTGQRYSKDDKGNYVEDEEGIYKLDEGEYVELSYAELGNYTYFPSQMTITLADSTTKLVNIEWDFSGVTVNYAGGTFTAFAYINQSGEYDFERADETVNEIGVQKIKVTINVVDGSAKSIAAASENVLKSYTGYIGSTSALTNANAVNPYEYVVPTMPTTLTVKLDDGSPKTYTEGANVNSLTWSYSTFKPNYQGGITKILAILKGEDGSIQKVDINFKVQKMEVNNVASTGYTSSVTNGLAATAFTVNPYDGTTLTLPTSYTATFNVYNPVVDNTTGKVTFNDTPSTTTTKTFSYVIVSMPTALTYYIKDGKWASDGDGKEATIQFANQERINVTIEVASTVAITSEPSLTASSSTLTTKVTVSGKSVPVVWYGTATVYALNGTTVVATYKVTLSSNKASMTPPSIAGRKVTYNLKAYVGAVVNKNGAVVTTKKVGDAEVPVGQYVTGNKSFTING